jgi:hypothetical protein
MRSLVFDQEDGILPPNLNLMNYPIQPLLQTGQKFSRSGKENSLWA